MTNPKDFYTSKLTDYLDTYESVNRAIIDLYAIRSREKEAPGCDPEELIDIDSALEKLRGIKNWVHWQMDAVKPLVIK